MILFLDNMWMIKIDQIQNVEVETKWLTICEEAFEIMPPDQDDVIK